MKAVMDNLRQMRRDHAGGALGDVTQAGEGRVGSARRGECLDHHWQEDGEGWKQDLPGKMGYDQN